jgi:exopolysaccharide biosynthesis polyprenyl glycosylphosphotransferase
MDGLPAEVGLEAIAVDAGGALVAAPAAVPVPGSRDRISYEAALRIAQVGRVAVIWLPIWAISVAQFRSSATAFVASLIYLAIWKAAFRRAYAEASVTVWTIGAAVPALVGAVTGALLATPVAVGVGPIRLPGFALLEIALSVLISSALWESTVARSLAARRRILVVGAGGGGVDLLEDVALAPRLPFEIVGVVDLDSGAGQIAGVPLLGTFDELPEVVRRERPQIVVLSNDRRGDAFEKILEVGHLGFVVVGVAEFYEYAFGRLPLRNLTPQWFMSVLHLYRRPYSQLLKRTFDVVVASFAAMLLAPVVPLVALLVRRTPGPTIFRQTRLGEGGEPFTIYKFRTMCLDAEKNGAVWASALDSRVTGAGRFLRKARLDEIPQLWNVLRGEMSIVGPRPERPEFVAQLEAEVPFWTRRHLVKPGITGWAQIRHGYTADAAGTGDKLSYDLWYLRHRSIVVDIAICAKTFWTLVSGSGAR